MGAYDEFAALGRLGPEGTRLLYAVVAAVARIRRFPPPDGYERWEPDSVLEVAHDFLVDRDGKDRMRQLFLLATDDESLERLLHQAVRNHLRSKARATEFGALMRRVRDVLEHDERFESVPSPEPRWTLRTSGVREPFTGQIDTLIDAGRRMQGLRVRRWNSERRRGPYADRETLARLCEHLLVAAQTALTVRQLARIVAARFNVGSPPLMVELDERLAKSTYPSQEDSVGEGLVVEEAARAVWSQLTERERLLVPVLEMGVREAASHIGTGKSQAAVSRHRVRTIVEAACGAEVDRGSVLRRLEELADDYFRTVE